MQKFWGICKVKKIVYIFLYGKYQPTCQAVLTIHRRQQIAKISHKKCLEFQKKNLKKEFRYLFNTWKCPHSQYLSNELLRYIHAQGYYIGISHYLYLLLLFKNWVQRVWKLFNLSEMVSEYMLYLVIIGTLLSMVNLPRAPTLHNWSANLSRSSSSISSISSSSTWESRVFYS